VIAIKGASGPLIRINHSKQPVENILFTSGNDRDPKTSLLGFMAGNKNQEVKTIAPKRSPFSIILQVVTDSYRVFPAGMIGLGQPAQRRAHRSNARNTTH